MATIRYSTGLRDEVNSAGGSSYPDAMAGGVIHIFGNSMPASADAAEGASPLVIITNGGLTHTAGSSTNGINFGVSSNGTTSTASGENWTGTGLVEGTPLWGRYYDVDVVTGASTTSKRIDFDIGASGSGAALELSASALAVVVGVPFSINSASHTVPANGA